MAGVFVWRHVFQSGDLPIFFSNALGPVDPYLVSYSFRYTPKGSECPILAGASGRTPVRMGVGQYYATGIAGQCGQPGDRWEICWTYQETLTSPVQEVCNPFVVFDTGAYCPTSANCGGSSGGCSSGCGSAVSGCASPSYGWG